MNIESKSKSFGNSTNQESLKSGSNFLHENDMSYKVNNEISISKDIKHENYIKLKEIAEGILTERYRYMKLKAPGFMDLVIEKIWNDRISLAHYYEQNGDLMADPDMEIIVDHDNETLAAATFQQDNIAIYHEAYQGGELVDDYLANELNHFLKEWLTNISNQGHKVYAAYYSDDIVSDQEEPKFDAQGNEVCEQALQEEDDLEI